MHHLVDFRSVEITSGSGASLEFEIPGSALDSFLEDGSEVMLDGRYTVFIGGSQPDERSFELTGKRPVSFTIEVKDRHISVG